MIKFSFITRLFCYVIDADSFAFMQKYSKHMLQKSCLLCIIIWNSVVTLAPPKVTEPLKPSTPAKSAASKKKTPVAKPATPKEVPKPPLPQPVGVEQEPIPAPPVQKDVKAGEPGTSRLNEHRITLLWIKSLYWSDSLKFPKMLKYQMKNDGF